MVSGCAVVIGKMVYVGGGASRKIEDRSLVFQYDPSSDEWSRLPPHHATLFAMAEFAGNLITVGGVLPGVGPTGKVYRFKEASQRWVEFLVPMPTARYHLSVATFFSTTQTPGRRSVIYQNHAIFPLLSDYHLTNYWLLQAVQVAESK